MATSRYISTDAIIIKTNVFREIDRSFTFISKDIGVNKAIAFGACKLKSRFCSTIQPFVVAKLNLYFNPQDQSYKLEDISSVETNDFIKTDINKIYLMSFFCEVISSSYISLEEFKSYYYLLFYSIELLKDNNINQKASYQKAFLFFVSKFLFLYGYSPQLDSCLSCQKQYNEYFFDTKNGGIFCHSCSKTRVHKITISAINLFRDFLLKKFIELKSFSIKIDDFELIYPILVDVVDIIFENKLKTIKSITFLNK